MDGGIVAAVHNDEKGLFLKQSEFQNYENDGTYLRTGMAKLIMFT